LGGRQRFDVDGVDAGHDLAELARDLLARRGVGRITQQLARDRDARDAAHDIGLAQAVLRCELEQHFRRAHAALPGRPQHAELGGAVERGRPLALAFAGARRIAAQDQRVSLAVDHGIEAPGLARGAARFAGETFDRGASAEMPAGGARQHGGDLVRFASPDVNGHSRDCGTAPVAW